MVAKIAVYLSIAAMAAAVAVPVVPVAKVAYAEPEAPAYYEFEYSVQDQHSGDMKQQKETRNGDAVQGSYWLVQPDGVKRIVDYTADKEHGFNAVVRYEGTPAPAPVKVAAPVAYATPVAKIAYAPAKVAYAPAKIAHAPAPIAYAPAPIAKVAYAAPVSKVIYDSNHGSVSFSSPAVSYQH